MADEQEDAAEKGAAKKGSSSMLLGIVVMMVAIGAGFGTPFLVKNFSFGESNKKKFPDLESTDPASFVQFDEIVVNLNESRLNRYLRLKITLQVDQEQKETVTKLVEAKKISLRNWLLGYLADQSLDSIRGAKGQNRMRREIQNHFNTELFSDNFDRIRGILFEEFNVQ